MNSSRTVLSGSIVKPPPPIAKMVRISASPQWPLVTRPDDEVALVAQAHRLDRGLAGDAVDRLDAVGERARARGHDAVELAADEVQRRAVVGRVARRHPVLDAREVLRPPARLAVVMDAVRPRQEAEPLDPRRAPVERGDRLLEPAQRARAQAAQDGPALPGVAQDLVEAMRAPHAEQRHDAAAADVDEVLREQVAGDVAVDPAALVAPEQRDVRRLADRRRERAVEADDVMVGVARGGGHEAHARTFDARQPEDVVVEEPVSRLHREPAATEGDDLRAARHGRRVRPPPGEVEGPPVEVGFDRVSDDR